MSEHITSENREMAQVLAKIVADKRIWVEERKASQPLESFKDALQPSDRSFYDALSTGKTAFILECKKASPSKGLIRDDFDLEYIASVYNSHASAISVLTDEKYFQGNFEFLPKVRSIAKQPVLCKDFMIDTYQIYLARHYQADAILLMLSVLSDKEYTMLADTAHSLGLGILTEASNEHELERAINLGAKVVGINNRNLRDLSVDLRRTIELAPKLPQGTTVISESGIYTNQQIRELSAYANGFLIGSSLMAEDDLELAVRRVLLGENKVCGLTHADDAATVYKAGAVYGGLIFAEKSPRKVDTEQARMVMSGAPLKYVGVFQNQSIETIAETAKKLGLAAVQLHGDEDQAFVDTLREKLDDNCAIWKAYGVTNQIPELLQGNIDKHLLDSKVGSQSGGTGKTFDWTLINITKSIMLAGGLNPDNIPQAIKLGCTGLDLNSGVESSPGKKDASLVNAAFAEIRKYNTPNRNNGGGASTKGNNMAKLDAYFGEYGGQFVPQILVPALEQLEQEFIKAQDDPEFHAEFMTLLQEYAGRPTALTLCRNLTAGTKTKLYLKREDLLHGGAHKTNQVLGQALLAKRMGKNEIIAETGAGQHGVATALACALLGLKCRVYMGAKDVERQSPNVFRMKLMGAEVIPVHSGSSTLKDACNEAMRDWSGSYETAHYLLGTAAGPHPFPTIVREFQRMIGEETKSQILAREGRLPDAVIACVGGGSNAIGMFADFIEEEQVKLIGVEPAGLGIDTDKHGAPLKHGKTGIFFGMKAPLMQDDHGQVEESYSVSAGLDFPSVGPQHAYLSSIGRAEYDSVTDDEALEAFQLLARSEGIIPALESSHALAHAVKMAQEDPEKEQLLVVNLSGRGDKDIFTVHKILEEKGAL